MKHLRHSQKSNILRDIMTEYFNGMKRDGYIVEIYFCMLKREECDNFKFFIIITVLPGAEWYNLFLYKF